MEKLQNILQGYRHRAGVITILENGSAREIKFSTLYEDVKKLTSFLSNIAEPKGHTTYIGVCAKNSYEWILLDLACMELGFILVAFPETYCRKNLDQDMTELGGEYLFSDEIIDSPNFSVVDIDTLSSLTSPLRRRKENSQIKHLEVEEDCYSISYSSGSTGSSKAIKISDKGISFLVQRYKEFFGITHDDKSILFMPFSSFQQRFLVYLSLYTGQQLVMCSPADFFHALRTTKPTYISCPPLMYKTLIDRYIKSLGRLQYKLLSILTNDESGRGLKLLVSRVIQKQLLKGFKGSLGGSLRYGFVGMAPSSRDIHDFYEKASVLLLEMYGLNEAGLISSNTKLDHRKYSVGKEFEPGSVSLGLNNELIVKKQYPLSIGYVERNSNQNSKVFKEKTIHTGDIGKIDDDGFIFILGRIKNILVTSTGKKFHPEIIEADIASNGQVIDCVLVRNRKGELICVALASDSADEEKAERYVRSKLHAAYNSIVDNVVIIDAAMTEYRTRNLKIDRKALESII